MALKKIYATTLASKVHQSMPLLDEVCRYQLLDTDIAPLFKYHENNKDKSCLSGSKYHREAPFTLVDNAILYYRTLIGDDDTLAHAQLLPDSLVPTVYCTTVMTMGTLASKLLTPSFENVRTGKECTKISRST